MYLYFSLYLQTHHAGCDFIQVNCPNDGCNDSVTQGSLSAHINNCEYRLVQCQHCEQEVTLVDLMVYFIPMLRTL